MNPPNHERRRSLARLTAAEIAEQASRVLPAECCAKCRFFMTVAAPGPGTPDATICRRFPPVLTLLAVPAPLPIGMIPREGQPVPMTFANQNLFAAVAPGLWCGEFSPAPVAPLAAIEPINGVAD